MTRRSLLFVGPRRLEIVEEPLARPPGSGQLLVETQVSAVSAGTERLAYRGELPADLPLDETLPALRDGAFGYPFRYGYAAVGEVAAVGAGLDPGWRGRRVFAFQPHASAFVTAADEVFPVPDGLPSERAALLASAETAVSLVHDGEPRLGERVAVVGQGVVGLLATLQLARFPLQALVAIEPAPARAAAARRMGATAVLAPGDDLAAALGPGGADLVYELSGDPAALDLAVAAAGNEARIVVGSWYGARRAAIDLGGRFHRGRLRIVSSQVSRIAPALAGRWDRRRRMAAAWGLLAGAGVEADALVTHRVPFAEAAAAYALLDQRPSAALQILLVH